MSHLGSYKWFRKTQVIPEYVVFYNECEEMRMSICLTWVPISGLGKPKLYQNMWCFTMCVWDLLGGSLTL